MSKYFLTIALACGIASPAAALPPLPSLLADAEATAFDAQAAEASLDAADAARATARSRLLPSFTASGSYAHNQYEAAATVPDGAGGTRTGTFVATNQLDATLGLTVPLLDLAAVAAVRARAAGRDAAEARREATRLLVAQATVVAYHDCVASLAVVRSAVRALEVSRESLRVLTVRRGAGLVSDLEVALAEAEVARKAQVLVSAEGRRDAALRRLERLVGHAVEATDADLPSPPADFDEPVDAYLTGVGRLPAVVAADADALAASRDVAAARRAALPVLSAAVSERFTNAPGFGEQPSYQLLVRASLTLDAAVASRAREARARALVADVEAERTRAAAEDTVRDAHDAARLATASLRASRAALASTARSLAIATGERAEGRITAVEFDRVARDAFDAEVAVLEAEAGLARAVAVLRLASGARP